MSTIWLIILLIGRGITASTSHPRSAGVDVSRVRRQEVSASSPMDTILVYNMTDFPGRVRVACFSGQEGGQITAEAWPYESTNQSITGIGQVNNIFLASEELPVGLVCYNVYGFRYKALAPFTDHRASLVPDRLSLTLDGGEDLRLGFTTWNPEANVLWRKEEEPIVSGRWEASALDAGGRLVVSSDRLSGPGFYSVVLRPPNSADPKASPSGPIGTISLLVRHCPEHRCGGDCSGWCPDCMNGGGCDEANCQCVCPPGLRGRLCHSQCPSRRIGSTCSLQLQSGSGLQVCLAHPYGCHCLPGYQGLRCDTGCDHNRWGVDCSQKCQCEGSCNSETGSCYSRPFPCTGGAMGLPRLRRPPQVTRLTEDSVRVDFDKWEPDYDDGQATPGTPIHYILRLLVEGREVTTMAVTPPSASVPHLQPGMVYGVQLVIRTKSGNLWCEAIGTGRERVHTVHFNVSCPKEPPVPRGVDFSGVTSNSFLVKWQTSQNCRLEVVVDVEDLKSTLVSGTELRVAGLKPFSAYRVVLRSYDRSAHKYSASTPAFALRTLPEKPGQPLVTSDLQGKELILKWQASPTDQGNLTYRYSIRLKFKACEKSLPRSSGWSETSTDTSVNLLTAPYTEVYLQVQTANEAGNGDITAYSDGIPSDVPNNKIREAVCSAELKICQISMERDCLLENGPGLRLDYFLRLRNDSILQYDFERSDSSTGQLTSSSVFNISLPDNLLPYMDYKVIMIPANDAGRNYDLEYTEVITTPPAAPGPVSQLRLEEGATSLTVKWAPPLDQPPRGRLLKYRIRWRRTSRGGWNEEEVPSYTQSHTMNDLQFNTEYTVKVRAKNADASDWGPPVEMSATTKQRQSVPRNLHVVTLLQTGAKVEWQEPERIYLPITSYSISVLAKESHGDHQISSYNVTAMTTLITSLKAGQHYLVRVAACSQVLCGHEAELDFWTKPKPLLPVRELEWTNASESTISLPVFSTYPVWQWIVVADAREPLTNDVAIKAVSQGIEDQSAKQSVWVAAKLYQDDTSNTKCFHLGDNETYRNFHNRPLEQNRGYKVTVVTVSRAGPQSAFYVSEPMTIPGDSTVPGGVVLAFLFPMMLLGVILAGVLYWRRCSPSNFPRMRRKADLLRESSDMTVHYQYGFEETENETGETQNGEVSFVPMNPTKVGQKGNLSPSAAAKSINILTKSVPIEQVEDYLAWAIHSPDTVEEFERVPTIMPKSCSDGERKENRPKNRYSNNLPYNETRVKLTSLPGQPFSDYINANYIQGHSRPNAYIATQGPKDFNVDTIGDFWRMIWENNSYIIVMLTNLMENGRVKVAKYWPEEKPLLKDNIKVALVSTKIQMDFIIRTLQVSKNGEERNVKQYHYTAWPDHGVPQNPFGLTHMLNILMEGYTTGPITVHCSAGIGRTGSIILTLFALDQLNTSGYIDTLQALITLRNGRGRLLENLAQYLFSLKVLQEVLTGTKTSYRCGSFPEEVARLRLHKLESESSLIHQQFKKLKSLPKDLTYTLAKDPACVKLNRNPDILPADSKIVCLQSPEGGLEHKYINLVRVSSMEQKDSYLAGEHPQKHTLRNMWLLVYERRILVWVLLHSFPDDHPEFPDVVPGEESLAMDGLSLTVKDRFSFKNFLEYHIEITAPRSLMSAPHVCVVLKMKGWPHTLPLPETPEPLLAILVRAKYITAQKGYMLFTCKDGVEGCGLAVAVLQVEDRINLLQEVDIYRSVLSIVYDRPQFISSIEQYDFLHTAALDYLKNNQHYSNFV